MTLNVPFSSFPFLLTSTFSFGVITFFSQYRKYMFSFGLWDSGCFAYGLAGDRENAIVAGCNEYISKPIVKDELMSLIQQYVI